jgi:hypothetical protein
VTDTLFADVSEWQTYVDDSYTDAGYRFISIRSNDGTYRDRKFRENYDWCRRSVDAGRLDGFIVYFVYRPNWADTLQTFVDSIGSGHEGLAAMLDVESWGDQIFGDNSDSINRLWWGTREHLGGDTPRVISYLNPNDHHIWLDRAPTKFVVPSYGRTPVFSRPGWPDLSDIERGMIAHQYTDGQGYGGGLPEGAPPFGRCDMNSANGLSSKELAAACGIGTGGFLMALTDDEQRELLTKTRDVWDQLRGPKGEGWPQLGQNADGANLTPVDALAEIKKAAEK